MINSTTSLFILLLSFDVILALAVNSNFLAAVRNSTLLHHKETNTVWEYLGTYAQTEDTVNFILEIPVFQFMCDVFPASLAYAMQACAQYRSRLLDNGSARRLNELFDAHVRKRERRQVEEIVLAGTALYGGYKIIGDLFGGDNDEIVHRLDESENFRVHQEKLDDVLVTSVLSLEDDNLIMLKGFKNLFDSVNATRSLIHSLLKMSLMEQKTFTGWAKFSLKSEMRRHYEQMVSAFTRVANKDLNLEMFSPEQRTFVHDFLWHRIRYNLPLNFSASLAQFVPNLLVQQIISMTEVNESEVLYELNEDDFSFVIEADSQDVIARNETIDLDSILPKIVGHARIENFFGIPTNFSNKTKDLYRITRLPLFVDEKKAVYTSGLPRYLSLGEDGSSSEWSDHSDRKCTFDEKSKYMFCSIPVPVYSSIQHPCLRSVILDNSTKDCLKETVDLSSPKIVKFTPNIYAISVHTSLQCFEKGDKENKNLFSNITKVALIKTRCNGFVSCGTFDFSAVGGICNSIESYIFTFNNTHENPFYLDKSVNPIDVDMNNLSQVLDFASLVESALSHKKHLEDAESEFQSGINHTLKTKAWPKVFLGTFMLILIVTICIIVFASSLCLKKVCFVASCERIHHLLCTCLGRRKREVEESSLNVRVHNSMPAQNTTDCHAICQNRNRVDQSRPLLNEVICENRTDHSLHPNYSTKQTSRLSSMFLLNCFPLASRNIAPKHLSNDVSYELTERKPNPLPRKIYDYMRESSDLTSNNMSITSGELFEEDHESDS